MSEKHVYKYPNGATLIYYQQNINKSTDATIGFKVPLVDIPLGEEYIYRYKNLISYITPKGNIRIPLIKPGIVHCAEHMFFKNLPELKKEEIYKTFRKTDTNYNAFTTDNSVCVKFDCPSKFAGEIFELESKMMLRNNFSEKELNEEKKVIYQELQSTGDNFNSIISHISATDSILTGSEILGMYKEVIDSITPNELKRFCRTHFTSQNLIMSVVSDLPFETIKELCEKNFVNKVPNIPESNVTVKPKTYLFDRDEELFFVDKKATTANIILMFKGSKNYEENEKMKYFEDFLLNNFTGRLIQKFRLENQLTYSPYFSTMELPQLTLKYFNITTTPENVNKCTLLLTEVLNDLIEKGITDEEMSGFKEMWINHRERKTKFKSRSSYNMFSAYICDEPIFIPKMYEKINNITKEEVNEYFRNVYANSPMIYSISGPQSILTAPKIEDIINMFRPYNKYATKNLENTKLVNEFYKYLQEQVQKNPKQKMSDILLPIPFIEEEKEEEKDENLDDEQLDDEEEVYNNDFDDEFEDEEQVDDYIGEFID